MPKAALWRGFLVSIQASGSAKFICGLGPFVILPTLQYKLPKQASKSGPGAPD
jgi:hypothetical protein